MAEFSTDLPVGVTSFLDKQDHPLRIEIERLRFLILIAESGSTESVKWNGLNYSFGW